MSLALLKLGGIIGLLGDWLKLANKLTALMHAQHRIYWCEPCDNLIITNINRIVKQFRKIYGSIGGGMD